MKSLGVDHVVDLGSENVTQSVKNFLKARNLKGVDVLYDPVGGKLAKESMRLLNWGANIVVIGFASGEVPVIPANIALVKVPLPPLLALLSSFQLIIYISTTRIGQCMDFTGVATKYINPVFLMILLGSCSHGWQEA